MGTQKSKIQIVEGVTYYGQLKQSKANGEGSLTISKGSQVLKFQGKFSNSLPVQGTASIGSLVYQGATLNGKFTGQGILKQSDLKQLKGIFDDGKFIEGEVAYRNRYKVSGKINNNNQLIEQCQFIDEETGEKIKGQFINGNLQGKGTYEFTNKDFYSGYFNSGQLKGSGSYISYSSKFDYQGNFMSSIPNEYGQIKFGNGDRYQGQLKNGYMHGKGIYTYANGTKYEGSFYYNSMTGDCQISYPEKNDIQKYQGQINQGLYNGLGVIEYANGVIYKGYFYQNMKNGPAIIIYGKRMFKCLFIMGRLINRLQEIYQHQ